MNRTANYDIHYNGYRCIEVGFHIWMVCSTSTKLFHYLPAILFYHRQFLETLLQQTRIKVSINTSYLVLISIIYIADKTVLVFINTLY